MKQVTGLTICCAILYAIDAFWFGGGYVSAVKGAAHDIYVHW